MEIIRDIENYIKFLKEKQGLAVSIHPLEFESVIGLTELIKFNSHLNPYCVFLKTNPAVWRHCIACQKKVLKSMESDLGSGVCHCGVFEYLYPIVDCDKTIGFISVSGYQHKDSGSYINRISRKYGLNKAALSERYYSDLKAEIPEKKDVDVLLNPLTDLFRLAYLTLPSGEKDPKNDLNKQIIHWINRNCSSKITLDDIANKFYCSKSYISHFFKKKNGVNLNEYINVRRIENAKFMLRKTDLSITEISGMVGFSDSNYFTVIFKKETGMTPKDYRKTGARPL